MDSSKNFPLTFENLTEFLHLSYGNKKLKETALEYTSDIESLKNMMNAVHDLTSNRNFKNRINRIIKRLDNNSGYYSSSDTSSIEENLN